MRYGFLVGVLVFLLFFGCGKRINEQFNDLFFEKDTVVVPNVVADKDYAFAVLGDNRPDSKSLEYFLTMIGKLDIEVVYHLGDLIQFPSPLFFISILEALESSFRDGDFYPVVGNHDVDGHSGNSLKTLDIFRHFMDISEPLGYRYQEEDGMHFILLNSYLPGEENSIGTDQMEWLESILEGISVLPNPLVFVFMHHPLFPAGAHAPLLNRDDLHQLLRAYPVTAVFSGHEHLYHFELHDDIYYFVSGGAGSTLHFAAQGNSINHFLAVSVTPNFVVDVFNIQGTIVDSQGEVLD